MSSFRNHRVVIASLFLPSTAVLGDESAPSTPDHNYREPPSSVFQLSVDPSKVEGFRAALTHSRKSSLPAPMKSIVEDLKDKSRAVSPAATPAVELHTNPFAGILRPFTITPATDDYAQTPARPKVRPAGRTTNSEYPAQSSRLRRKSSSRSQTRRSDSDSLFPGSKIQPWHIESNPNCNGGLKNAVASVKERLKRKLWIGTLGNNTDSIGDGQRKDIDRRMMDLCDSQPVWIPDAEFESCYDEFCHQVLWPCLHYAIPDAPKTKLFYESASFKQYVAVNQRFADAIIANYKEGDIIWVNDYHLMLLPSLLRASPKFPSHVPIGFFMHVAFPSSEIFRCLSVRESLLRGLLAADLVGFQTASFARHFRQTVSRILSLEALPKGIQVDSSGTGRFVDVGVFPMGIDVGALREKKRDPEVAEWVQLLKQRYAGMKIVVGRDKLDEIQGVRQKILAFEMFLDKNPEFQQKVVLIQVALPTTESNELAGGVADLVSHINSRFSTLTYQPVVFLHTQDLTFSQYLGLLSVADAFLVTSLREGMALRTHEFVECQEGRHRPLILSEFTGSYSYSGFRSCIAINPWDSRGTAKAIHQALTMDDEEALSRWKDLHNHVVTQTAQAFVTSFLTRCIRANSEHLQADVSTVERLDLDRLIPRYKHSQRRLLLIEFEGTLWQRDISRTGLLKPFSPPQDAVDLLNKLTEDVRNEVWLLSGLPVKGMMDMVAEKVPKIGIVAENGCFIKTRPTRKEASQWINMVVNFNLTWKTACVEILNYFSERTPGSWIEEREASVVWRFWTGSQNDSSPDRQWARRQAAEAQNHIFDSLGERYGLRIIPGKNSFLVLPNNISRSTAVGAVLHPGGPAHSPLAGQAVWMSHDVTEDHSSDDVGFVLAVGSDEKLLRRLNDLDHAETCSTSNRGTDARWKLEPEEVSRALWSFANV